MTVSAQDGAGNFLVLHDYLPLLIVEEKNDGSDGGESDGGDNDPNVSGTLESTLSPHNTTGRAAPRSSPPCSSG